MSNFETCAEIECTLANFFGYRQNIIVPNVSWGLSSYEETEYGGKMRKNLHECDMLILSESGYATEIEIKVSKSDLLKDKKKSHGHKSNKIKYLYFAIPEKLDKEEILKEIPERAGIIVIKKTGEIGIKRKPAKNKNCTALKDCERLKIAHLGAMRIWGLKRKLLAYKENL